jgi:phosphatidylinositol kinase/protein kinase (PI-3  family)
LDERVMQLLRQCNFVLGNNKKRAEWPEYACNNYSVIPLGQRSGLIQWVEGATPLFQIYRKWRAKEVRFCY